MYQGEPDYDEGEYEFYEEGEMIGETACPTFVDVNYNKKMEDERKNKTEDDLYNNDDFNTSIKEVYIEGKGWVKVDTNEKEDAQKDDLKKYEHQKEDQNFTYKKENISSPRHTSQYVKEESKNSPKVYKQTANKLTSLNDRKGNIKANGKIIIYL